MLSGLWALKGNKYAQLPKGAQGSKGVRGALSRSRGPKMLNGNACYREPQVLKGPLGALGILECLRFLGCSRVPRVLKDPVVL